jgi:hypothetical protein
MISPLGLRVTVSIRRRVRVRVIILVPTMIQIRISICEYNDLTQSVTNINFTLRRSDPSAHPYTTSSHTTSGTISSYDDVSTQYPNLDPLYVQ